MPYGAKPNCLMPYIPQIESTSMINDTSTWAKVSGYFTAVGDEQYLTIGNFRLNANTNTVTINPSVNNDGTYFYIDDVSVRLCSDTAISVNEIDSDKFKIELYPSPSNGTIILNYTSKQNGIGAIKFYDITGKLVERYELNSNRNELQLITNLDNGIYLYQVIVNNKTVKTDKLVVIKQQ